MAAPKATRIAIGEDGRCAKVTQILPFRDGGIAVSAPYTSVHTGYVFSLQPGEKPGKSIAGVTAEYSASDRVKLSLHRSGLAQFSGKGITSGLDQDGKPKGLAIQVRRPFMYPIQTGPTVGMTLWGLDGFETLRNRDMTAALAFGECDVTYYPPASANNWNGYILEIFVFPSNLLAQVEPRGSRKTVLRRYFQPRGRSFEFRVMLLPNQAVFLGLLLHRAELDDNLFIDSSSGFILGGPRDFEGTGLYACHPAPADAAPSASLDWVSDGA